MPTSDDEAVTVTEQRILEKLATGRAYSLEELRGCLTDVYASDGAVRFHIFNLRRKLRRYGRAIETRRPPGTNTTYYRQVQLLSRNDE